MLQQRQLNRFPVVSRFVCLLVQVKPTGPPKPKSNPFGSAKPVDVSARLKELEERDNARKVRVSAFRLASHRVSFSSAI